MQKTISLFFFILIFQCISIAQEISPEFAKVDRYIATQNYSSALSELNEIINTSSQEKIWEDKTIALSKGLELNLYLKDIAAAEDWKNKLEALIYNQLNEDCQYLKTSHLSLGTYYYEKGDYNIAVELTERGLDCLVSKQEIAQSDSLLLADYYYNIGIYYAAKNDLDKSLHYSVNALHLHEQFNNYTALSDIYHNLGNLFYKNGRFQEALDYILKGRDIQATLVDGQALDNYFINCNAHVASTYRQLGNIDSAFAYIEKSIDIHQRTNTRSEETYKVFAQLYIEQKNWERAEDYGKQSLLAAEKAYGKMHPRSAESALLLAEIHLLQTEYKQSHLYLQQAFNALMINPQLVIILEMMEAIIKEFI